MSLDEIPFDRVLIGPNGTHGELSYRQFYELRLSQRVRLILEGDLTFLLSGTKIEKAVALRRVMDEAQRSTPPVSIG